MLEILRSNLYPHLFLWFINFSLTNNRKYDIIESSTLKIAIELITDFISYCLVNLVINSIV